MNRVHTGMGRMRFLPFFLLRWYERKRLKRITEGNEIKRMNYFE